MIKDLQNATLAKHIIISICQILGLSIAITLCPSRNTHDVAKYVGKSNEYTKNKPSTIFVDIDGTLLKHQHAISCVYQNKPKLLKGVRAKLDEWDSIGHCIILVTARKESARKITEKHLEELAIPYDKLIMGVSSGRRIIINDKQEEQFDRATAVNVITDQGFEAIDWEAYAL